MKTYSELESSPTTYEFIDACCFWVDFDSNVKKRAEERARSHKFTFVSNITREPLSKERALECMLDDRFVFEHDKRDSPCPDADDIFKAAGVLHLYGQDELSNKLLIHAYQKLIDCQLAHVKLSGIEDVIKSSRQKTISSKPRKPQYQKEALRIARLTWEKYPGASKKRMCEKIRDHFDGRVSLKSLDNWIKKEKIQPPPPKEYVIFRLILS
ncbi:hypothetical protein [Pectobacterium wasabiae]|uniref:hypothetical protein n=1 Tax=Pectobacterium wasabiae TaxID=55208 RepID=UPI00027AFD50|nr:hypothetical protein [Pectobacterium wasabiae]AOR63834.1 hypothetical protein A7983_11295 [Pectobacterium wasabiae CFBP 3304]EJS94225.1 Hypothetical protein Y17_2271 [Pectobacterium wasabiae CFBP 3304]